MMEPDMSSNHESASATTFSLSFTCRMSVMASAIAVSRFQEILELSDCEEYS